MKEFRLAPFFPNQQIWISLILNVENPGNLREATMKGELQACLINPELVLDSYQILVAANKALNNQALGKMKTRSLYSELLFSLSPTNKINTSLDTFGINKDSSNVLIVTIGSESDALLALKMVEGDPVDLEYLKQIVNKEQIKKVFKISETEESSLLQSIITTMATKDVK